MPERLFTKLKYGVTYAIAIPGSAGSVSNLNYFAPLLQTSLYDPEYNSGGHQPMWYDQLGTFYNKYKVYGIKYKFTLTNIDGTKPFCLVVDPSHTATTDNNFQLVAERQGTKMRWGNGVYSNRPVVVRGYMSTARAIGVPSRDIRADAYYEGDWNANPVRVGYLKAYVHTTDSVVANMEVRVEAIYYAELYQRVEVGQS